MASARKNCSIPPSSGDAVVKKRAFVVVRERVRLVTASSSASLFFTVYVESLCRTHAVAKNTKNTNGESRAGGTRCTTNHRYDLRREVSAVRCQDFGGTCSDRYRKISFLDHVAVSYRWESREFCQHDPNDARIHRSPWCYEPSMSSKSYLSIRE